MATAWQGIRRLADRLEPKMQRAFLDAMRQVAGKVNLNELAAAIGRGDIRSATRVVGKPELRAALGVINDAFGRAGKLAGGELGVGVNFAERNPLAVKWAKQQGAKLVTGVNDQIKKQIRAVIVEAIDKQKLTSRDAARKIRSTIGMTPQQAVASVKYDKTLRDRALKPERIEALSKKFEQRQINARAKTIARTELMQATNRGQLALWTGAQKEGLLGADAKKVWITTPDDRLCERCAPMNGQEVPLNKPFKSTLLGDEETTRAATQTIATQTPPLHPRCRCALACEPGAGGVKPSKNSSSASKGPSPAPAKTRGVSALDVAPPLPRPIAAPTPALQSVPVAVEDVVADAATAAPEVTLPAAERNAVVRAVEFDADPWADPRFGHAPTPYGREVTQKQVDDAIRKLKAAGRLNDDGTVSLYHATLSETDDIMREGLIPARVKAPGQEWVANLSSHSTYFHLVEDVAIRDIEFGGSVIEARIPVNRRTLARFLPDEDTSLDMLDGLRTLVDGGGAVAFIGGVPPSALRVAASATMAESGEAVVTVFQRTTKKVAETVLNAMGGGPEVAIPAELVVNRYVSGEFYNIQEKLRRGEALSAAEKESVERLDAAIKKYQRSAANQTVYRTLPDHVWENLKPGQVVTDAGFCSTSKRRDIQGYMQDEAPDLVGENFKTVQIFVPRGSRCLDVNMWLGENNWYREQREVLLPRGSRFVVTPSRTLSLIAW